MDWAKLLADMRLIGLTQGAIAQKCGVAQSTVSDLARGGTKSPSFELGDKLIRLYESARAEVEPDSVLATEARPT